MARVGARSGPSVITELRGFKFSAMPAPDCCFNVALN
jgi:hypothetical protein